MAQTPRGEVRGEVRGEGAEWGQIGARLGTTRGQLGDSSNPQGRGAVSRSGTTARLLPIDALSLFL